MFVHCSTMRSFLLLLFLSRAINKQTTCACDDQDFFELLKSVDCVIQHRSFQLKRIYLGTIKQKKIQLHNCHFPDSKDNLGV